MPSEPGRRDQPTSPPHPTTHRALYHEPITTTAANPSAALRGLTPADAIRRWPAGSPLAVIWRSGQGSPTRLMRVEDCNPLSVHDLSCLNPSGLSTECETGGRGGGWVLALSYDLGRDLEPAAQHPNPARPPSPWPRIHLQRVEAAYRYDHDTGEWAVQGDASTLPDLSQPDLHEGPGFGVPGFETGQLTSDPGRSGYLAAAERVLEYIRAGDVYQANLAHRLSAPFHGSARALFAALAESADPWHGAYLETDLESAGKAHRLAWCSASPELFLDYDPTSRTVTTRPMKGTQPIGADPAALEHSPKERAELAMIVDLMRNDLGRVAEYGSVRVSTPRATERHADSVRHTTATVQATLRQGLGPADLIAACFPAGSITGAPKVRAMQIIDELEPGGVGGVGGAGGRGPWCGSIGFLADDGRLSLNVAIRTATIHGEPSGESLGSFDHATLDYWAGAGLVADSVPEREWEETLLKAEVLTRVLAANAPKPAGAGT